MVWYRVNGSMVHMRLGRRDKKRAPPPCCAKIEIDGKPELCMQLANFACDWQTGEGTTCSKPLCKEHAKPIEGNPDLHLCAEHAIHAYLRSGGKP